MSRLERFFGKREPWSEDHTKGFLKGVLFSIAVAFAILIYRAYAP